MVTHLQRDERPRFRPSAASLIVGLFGLLFAAMLVCIGLVQTFGQSAHRTVPTATAPQVMPDRVQPDVRAQSDARDSPGLISLDQSLVETRFRG